MGSIPWQLVFQVLSLLWSAASPTIKAAALAELQALAVQFAGNPLLEALVKEAEVLVAAA